jgi:hypothetical protein
MRVPLAALILGAVGCTVVRPVSQPAQYIPQNNPDVVVVVYKDRSQVPVVQPRMNGDTLVGTWAGLGEPVVVPMDQVERIEARQKDKKRTTLLIAGVTAATVAGVWAFTQLIGNSKACDYTYQPGSAPNDNCFRDNN